MSNLTLTDTAFVGALKIPSVGQMWAANVVLQGGAAPASGTISAINTFWAALVSAGIDTKMVAINVFAPDNLTATRVPILARAGNAIWTNHNFVSGDLSTSGLKGDGSSKYLDTGIIPNSMPGTTDSSAGLSLLMSVNPSSTNGFDIGCGGNVTNSQFAVHINGISNTTPFICWTFTTSGTTYINPAPPSATFAGFISGNRTASNALAVYAASTSHAFSTLGTGSGSNSSTAFGPSPLCVFALNSLGSITNYSNRTLSFAAIHAGLTSTETQALYNAVAALRTSLGGGNP